MRSMLLCILLSVPLILCGMKKDEVGKPAKEYSEAFENKNALYYAKKTTHASIRCRETCGIITGCFLGNMLVPYGAKLRWVFFGSMLGTMVGAQGADFLTAYYKRQLDIAQTTK